MAEPARYTMPLSFTTTSDQYDLINDEADRRAVSVAQILREAVAERYALEEEA